MRCPTTSSAKYIADLRQFRLRPPSNSQGPSSKTKSPSPRSLWSWPSSPSPSPSPWGKRGGLIGIATAIGVGIVYMGISSLFSSMGEISTLPPLLAAWSPDPPLRHCRYLPPPTHPHLAPPRIVISGNDLDPPWAVLGPLPLWYHGFIMKLTSTLLFVFDSARSKTPSLLKRRLQPNPNTANACRCYLHARSRGHAHRLCEAARPSRRRSRPLPTGSTLRQGASTPLTTVPSVKIDYAAPLVGSSLAETLGIESLHLLAQFHRHQNRYRRARPRPHKWYTVKYTGYLTDGHQIRLLRRPPRQGGPSLSPTASITSSQDGTPVSPACGVGGKAPPHHSMAGSPTAPSGKASHSRKGRPWSSTSNWSARATSEAQATRTRQPPAAPPQPAAGATRTSRRAGLPQRQPSRQPRLAPLRPRPQ